MNRFLMQACSAGLVVMIGCSDDGSGQRVSVDGTVTLDGKPVEDALIRFVPLEKGHDVLTTISGGQFSLDQATGPTTGPHRLMVLPNEPELDQAIAAMQRGERDPLRSQTIPRQYQTRSELTESFSADGPNHLRLELTSR